MESIRSYWGRKSYQRLNRSGSRRSRVEVARLGSKRRRFWRIKITPKIKFKIPNPKKLLIRLRDAYVKAMLSLANSRAFTGGGNFSGMSYGQPFARPPVKEYDEKMLVEIYRSLMAQGQIVAVGGVGNEINGRR
ncbi:hypothetical protein AMTRI_Chr02g221570 [Amborella trichopoda]|uniref:Uncharacterized protein n=1 Tax=Amborella trichopoda TaxID=13333 RepID=U5CU52_AMBTC|nr:uncharacterized protein LOC18445154 [Amborella trichopoda]ERN16826.1 hypothetical protein AMTR_s00057p00113710 [Amborella trichopoda]|eukprot:XP_011627382.1 uncharacterized protein LOC18445154 [Amborella trichopoda]